MDSAAVRKPARQLSIALDQTGRMALAELRASARRDETVLAAARLKHVLDPSHRLVAVTALNSRDGVSALIARTAMALAEIDREDLLILDANSPSSQLSRSFGITNEPGLREVLQERMDLAEALRIVDPPNLQILPAGVGTGLLAPLLATAAWPATLKYLRERFRYVLIDSGPIGSAESMLIAAASDGVVLALAVGRTKEEVARVQGEFRNLQIPLLGVMLTQKRRG